MRKKQTTFHFIKIVLLMVLLTFCMMGCGGTSEREYTASVILSGGSGRAYIQSPCRITEKNGETTADIIWSSPNYDYMIVDGKTYYPVNTEGNSEFIIPVEMETDMAVQADTTAMSTPHLIDYTLRFTLEDTGEGLPEETGVSLTEADVSKAPEIPGLTYRSTDENAYAGGFAIHRYENDYTVISVRDGRNYLLVPEGEDVPEGEAASAGAGRTPESEGSVTDDNSVIILHKPIKKIYLAASSVMCHFDAVDAVGVIRLSGLERDDWFIESARYAMDRGDLIYGGKYSAPDYEKMILDDIDLAIESTMILHVPKVQEKIEKIGIPVFTDWSSYEEEPLGRCEWIKVYGVLTGKEDKAAEAFASQCALVERVRGNDLSGKTVVFFYVNSNHQIVTRKKDDYFAKMVNSAGGTYLAPSEDEEGTAKSQMTISMEAFYAYAAEADILIYNSAIADAPASVEALCRDQKSFFDFKAVKEGMIWYTDKSLYQYTDRTGTIIEDLSEVIIEGKEETGFFHKLR